MMTTITEMQQGANTVDAVFRNAFGKPETTATVQLDGLFAPTDADHARMNDALALAFFFPGVVAWSHDIPDSLCGTLRQLTIETSVGQMVEILRALKGDARFADCFMLGGVGRFAGDPALGALIAMAQGFADIAC
jgi:hypothetical protein